MFGDSPGIIDELISKAWSAIVHAFTSFLPAVILAEWMAVFAIFSMAVVVVVYFLGGFKWIRAGLGAVWLGGLLFFLGGLKMRRDLKRTRE